MSDLRLERGAAWLTDLEAWLADSRGGEVLRDNPRRRLLRLAAGDGSALLLKVFRSASGRHPWREGVKNRLHLDGARREFRALADLHAEGVPVPEPLALGTLPDGDRLLLQRFVDGRPLEAALTAGAAERRPLLAELGRAVHRLHAAGWSHGDLHVGNALVAPTGIVLLDLQHARPRATASRRLRDLGWLDDSLSRHVSLPDRLRFRTAALGIPRPYPDSARPALREVGRAASRRADRHARSRTRRCTRPGRRFAAVRLGPLRGLRLRELPERALADALHAHEARAEGCVLKDDGRSAITRARADGRKLVVKEVQARGVARPLADLLRGSPGFRAWRGGHGLLARGVGAATPLAFVERRRFGIPLASLVVLEDLAPRQPADVLAEDGAPPEALARALAVLADRLHARRVVHGDLKASHVYLSARELEAPARLLDLEGVRFPRRLREPERLHALTQLNASLPDALPSAARRSAFGWYARRHPFRVGREAALRRIVRESLARAHRWSGKDCSDGAQEAQGRSSTIHWK